jgi:large subunit ribosomal protein L36e
MAKGLAVGLNKGYVVSKIEVPSKRINKNPRKRVKLIRKIVAEISGRSAYERKVIEILKQGHSNSQKKAYKLCKKRLGTHKRGMRKRQELTDYIDSLRQ